MTGRGIIDPDLIYIGQRLIIPVVPNGGVAPRGAESKPEQLVSATKNSVGRNQKMPSPQPVRQPGPLSRELPKVESPISLKYKLEDIKVPPVDVGIAIIEYSMTGLVVLRSSKSYPATYVTNRNEIESQAVHEINHAFGKLVSDNHFIYNAEKKQVTLRTMIVSKSNTPNAPSSAIGIELPSNSPMLKLRAEIIFPKLVGRIGLVPYTALNVKFVITITPKLQPPLGPSPQPIRVREPAPSTNWETAAGTALIITAGGIVLATIVEDFLTVGVGAADDPASFAAAAAAFARGISFLRGSATALLPTVVTPARVGVGTRLQFAH